MDGVSGRQGPPRLKEATVATDESSSLGLAARPKHAAVAMTVANGLTGASTTQTPGAQTAVHNAPFTTKRALWIYLKYRGVLNVEEFRRTRAHHPATGKRHADRN